MIFKVLILPQESLEKKVKSKNNKKSLFTENWDEIGIFMYIYIYI